MPVVEYFRGKDRVVEVRADITVEEVFEKVKAGIEARNIHPR